MNKPTFNHGLKGFSPNGGHCTLKNCEPAIGGGARNLTQAEYDAYKKAQLYAMPENGGDWSKARELLEAAGFEVLAV